jgi:flagellar biosynthesis protein FlhB
MPMASDELKRHPPTARRLERLRQAGDLPQSPVLTGVAAVAVATAVVALGGSRLLGLLGATLAQDLQRAGVMETGPETLRELLTGHLAQALGLVMFIGGIAAATMTLAHLLQTGFQPRGAGGAYRPAVLWEVGGQTGPRRGSERRTVEVVIGLAGIALLLKLLADQMAGAGTWGEAGQAGLVEALWLRWLVVLGALGVVHWMRVRGRYWRRAAMSDRELREESREVEGPPLDRRRRASVRQKVRDHG